MMLEMIVYENGKACLIFNYIREHNLEIFSVDLIPDPESNINTMLVYVWCNPEHKEELIRLKNIEDRTTVSEVV